MCALAVAIGVLYPADDPSLAGGLRTLRAPWPDEIMLIVSGRSAAAIVQRRRRPQCSGCPTRRPCFRVSRGSANGTRRQRSRLGGKVPQIPDSRIRVCNTADVRGDADYVLYWMIAFRRTGWNHSLQRAADWAEKLAKPLVILEALRVGYPWASDRLHHFVLNGMADNAWRLQSKRVHYHAYVEERAGDGKGLLSQVASRACLVVTDDYPAFFLPRMVSAAARQVPASRRGRFAGRFPC